MERPAGGVIDRRAFHPIAFDQRLTVICPLLLFSEAALPQFSKRTSAKRRKIRPRTGAEYSWDLSPELARNWSAASQRRLSSVAVAVSFSLGAIQRMRTTPPTDRTAIPGHYGRIR